MAKDSARVIPLREPWQRPVSRGLEALRRGDLTAATLDLRRAQDLAPDEPDVCLALARLHLAQEELRPAVALLERVVALRPDKLGTIALLTRTLGVRLGEKTRAFGVLHAALERHPESAELHVVRGELLVEDDAIEAARGAFAQALTGTPGPKVRLAALSGLAQTYNAEGILLSEGGESDRAAFLFKRAADLDPLWSAPLVNLGVVFGRLERLPKAIETYDAALLRDPENPVALFNIGSIAHRLGRLDQAVEALEELYNLAPDYPGLRVALANVLGDRRDFDRAIAFLLEELEISPDSVTAWSALGLAYTCAGNTARGEECLHEALARDPDRFDAFHNLAVIYTTQGRRDDAVAILERAFGVDPQRARSIVEADASLGPLRDLPRLRPWFT